MTCEERVRSEDYVELLVDYEINEPEIINRMGDYCIVPVDSDMSVVYMRTDMQMERNVSWYLDRYPYYTVPKCYGLMQQEQMPGGQPFDSLALSDAGILQMQQAPLSLTGRGVIIGLIDTGYGVMELQAGGE